MKTFQQFITEEYNFKRGELIGVKIANIDYIPLAIGSTEHEETFDNDVRWNGNIIGKFLYRSSLSIWYEGKEQRFYTIIIQPLNPAKVIFYYPGFDDSNHLLSHKNIVETNASLQYFFDETDELVGDVILHLPIDFITITKIKDMNTNDRVNAQGELF